MKSSTGNTAAVEQARGVVAGERKDIQVWESWDLGAAIPGELGKNPFPTLWYSKISNDSKNVQNYWLPWIYRESY